MRIVIGMMINGLLVAPASFVAHHSRWMLVQRWFMGAALGALAMRMIVEGRR